tara:strand:- start:601 stop:864 length:264 start_codon:yes stop_codon:yes gene_type:complete
MFKNIIIVVLVFILCSLLFQNRENVNILVKDMADTKELVVDSAKYVKEVIDKEFSEQEFKLDIDIPSMQIEKEPMIREDTFFKEDNK